MEAHVHSGRRLERRWFLAQTGKGVLGVAVLGVAACTSSSGSSPSPSPTPSGARTGSGTTGSGSGPASTSSQATATSANGGSTAGGALAWNRVDLGFVAAYVLVRGQEAAVVDTGVSGSADAIGTVLQQAGPGWDGVRHVILTHKHADHAGSIAQVLTQASNATGYIGSADLSSVQAPRTLQSLADGQDVFGLRIVGTPGHTAGHISVFDTATKVLVAGDALTNQAGLAGSNPQFTEDTASASASVRKLAALAPTTVLFGHGQPLTQGAAAALDQLASSLS